MTPEEVLRANALLSPREVAEVFHLRPSYLARMRLEHRGPRYIKLGPGARSPIKYRVDDIEAWLETCAVDSAP